MPADDQFELHLPAPPAGDDTPLVPARMVNICEDRKACDCDMIGPIDHDSVVLERDAVDAAWPPDAGSAIGIRGAR